MFDLIRNNQLDIMLFLCGACGILILLLINTRFLSPSRKRILIFMETVALLLLWFDRQAYIHAADPTATGYIMVRISNFLVYFLTSAIVLGLNLYLKDYLKNEGGQAVLPKRVMIVEVMAVLGMIMSVISAFTGLYYYFDESNKYHRGDGFIIAYIIPVICPIMVYTVIRQYKKIFSRLIYISMVLYIFVPITMGVIQIFAYGISIVNMSMVVVSISLYFFTYLDLNNDVERAHKIEMEHMAGENIRMKRLFDQTANAFVSAVEKKDDFSRGNAVKVAEYARMIAEKLGKDEEYCERAYYTALLHDVGLIGIPDSVIKNEGDPDEQDQQIMRQKPLIGEEILSSITEYPYLSIGAHYSHERYNGTGYPEGLKGEDIPEIARLVAVADAYVSMTSKKRFRDARPDFIARENFVMGSGLEYDPQFADMMVRILDMGLGQNASGADDILEDELKCEKYKENRSAAILIGREVTRISFLAEDIRSDKADFSAPSIILFDSFDKHVHSKKKSIGEYQYLEYGEIWFDEHMICTAARKMVITDITKNDKADPSGKYEIVAGRFGDHMKLRMTGPEYVKEITVALPDSTKAAYIALTGEHCRLYDITSEHTGDVVKEGDIPRISDVINYLDHMESDIKNIQIDRPRSAATPGVEIKDHVRIAFHTMSLPGASLVWHCPYVVLFYSDDGLLGGKNYKQFNELKINGENNGENENCKTTFSMKKTDDFPGWDVWKDKNKEGLDCVLEFEKKGNQVSLVTETLGIRMESTSVLNEPSKVYVSITGDQVVLTDIRVI